MKKTVRGKIQYDLRSVKVLRYAAIISFFIFVGTVIMRDYAYAFAFLVLLGIYGGGAVCLISALNLLCAQCYFYRLKLHGYRIPENKKLYGDNLRNVPRERKDLEHSIQSKDSQIVGTLHLLVWIVLTVYSIRYVVAWYQYMNDALLVFIIQVVLEFGWLICAIYFYRQKNSVQYRDDVEIDDERKIRISLERGVLSCVVVLFFCVVGKYTTASMTSYIFQTHQIHDQENLEMLQNAIGESIKSATDEKQDLMQYDSYNQMVEGCYITEWTTPSDTFAKNIVEWMQVDDYSTYCDKIYTADGEPRVYVKISGDQVIVRLDNPLVLKGNEMERFSLE